MAPAPPLKVLRIPIPKDRLKALPSDERVLFLLLGYVSNQIAMLQKLVVFSLNTQPENEPDQYATGAQSEMLVRMLVGAVNEAWLLVERRFTSNPIGKEYLPLLDQGGQLLWLRLSANSAARTYWRRSETTTRFITRRARRWRKPFGW